VQTQPLLLAHGRVDYLFKSSRDVRFKETEVEAALERMRMK
jgi:hypothetical protein